MATGEPAYNPSIGASNPTPPVTIDGTGLTTTIPITIKNGKADSGIELWYTGTVATGYDLMNASGVLKGGIAIAGTTNDWVTGSAADDIIIHSGATKKIRIGAKGAAAANIVVDCATAVTWTFDGNGLGTNVPSATNAGYSINQLGVLKAYAPVWTPALGLLFGTQGTGGRVSLQTNGTEKVGLLTSGDVVIGAGDTAATVLATTATAGFLRLATCAGPPTGAAVNGSLVLDTATVSGKLWARVAGTWVGIALV